MASVDVIRSHQKNLLPQLRQGVADGGHFALTGSDEFEEILHLLGVPALVYNYWNFVIVSRGKAAHYADVLEAHGYQGPHFFALGFASMLSPEEAPWGGLPRPTFMIGSGRSEAELRVTELWAEHVGAPFFPVDFNMSSNAKQPMPADWRRRIRSDWEALIDRDRLDLRDAENRALITQLEEITGNRISEEALDEMMTLVNTQMDLWMEANDALLAAEYSPVTFRDQMSMYQAMWYRGTQFGVDLVSAYRDEVFQRIADGVRAHEPQHERMRLLYWTMREEPRSHGYLKDQGAVIVSAPYLSTPALYARELYGDPLRALASRQLFLFDMGRSSEWVLSEARRAKADGVVLLEAHGSPPSADRIALEREGIPVLSLPGTEDSPETRRLIDEFLSALG